MDNLIKVKKKCCSIVVWVLWWLTMECVCESGCVPVRGSEKAAGWDLVSNERKIIPAYGFVSVDVGLRLAIPDGYFGRIESRSGLAFRYNVTAFPGIIDSDYRGVLKVGLRNHSGNPFEVKKLMRVAQLVLYKVQELDWVPVDSLGSTKRGEGGFGSSGGI